LKQDDATRKRILKTAAWALEGKYLNANACAIVVCLAVTGAGRFSVGLVENPALLL
jgi:hypothetical protein